MGVGKDTYTILLCQGPVYYCIRFNRNQSDAEQVVVLYSFPLPLPTAVNSWPVNTYYHLLFIMSISNPTQLVDAYKSLVNSTAFDANFWLRSSVVCVFHDQSFLGLISSHIPSGWNEPFMNRVEDIARQKLESDQRLHYMPPESVHRELTQELDR